MKRLLSTRLSTDALCTLSTHTWLLLAVSTCNSTVSQKPRRTGSSRLFDSFHSTFHIWGIGSLPSTVGWANAAAQTHSSDQRGHLGGGKDQLTKSGVVESARRVFRLERVSADRLWKRGGHNEIRHDRRPSIADERSFSRSPRPIRAGGIARPSLARGPSGNNRPSELIHRARHRRTCFFHSVHRF